jgi:putative ABC transport system permease protein
VVLGVAFLSTSFFLTDRLRDTFDELATDISGELDLVVRASIDEGANRINRLPVPEEVLGFLQDVPGIRSVAPSVMGWNVVPLYTDDNGELTAIGTNGGAPQFGFNYGVPDGANYGNTLEDLSQLFITDGRAPLRTESISDPDIVGEFMLDNMTADEYGFTIGKTYTVSAPIGNRQFVLVGTANFGDPDENKNIGANISAFDEETAQEVANKVGVYDEIAIALADDANEVAVMTAIRDRLDIATAEFRTFLSTLPEDQQNQLAVFADAELEVVTAATKIAEDQSDFDQFLNIISSVLLGFSVIAVVVSAFIINNTFSIVIGQRVRELALLRALGATGRQISRSVRLEAVVIGVVASALGLLAGYLLAALLRWVLVKLGFGDLPGSIPIRPRTIVVASVVGVGATLLSSIGPSRRVRKIPPVAALRDDLRLTPTGLRRRLLVGGAVAVAGIGALAAGMTIEMSTRLILVAIGGGALAAFIGVYLLSPAITGQVATVLGWPIRKVYRIPGRLATDNARRSPRRTAATAAALTIGLALVSLAAVVSDSLKATFLSAMDQSVEADLFVYGDTFNPQAGFSTELGADLQQLAVQRPDLVKSVLTMRWTLGGVRVGDGFKDVVAAELAVLNEHMDLEVIEGAEFRAGTGGVLVHVDSASDLGLTIGDSVAAEFPGNRISELTVAAIFEDSTLLGNWVVDVSVFDSHLPTAPLGWISVRFPVGADHVASRAAIEVYTDAYPQVVVENRSEFRDAQEKQLDQLLSIIQVFLGLSLLIAVLGITNTMALSVYERTRELGLLRAIGMTRRQLRRMVRWEAVIIALFGGLLGVAMGVLFGLAVIAALPETFVDIVSIPYTSLFGYLLVSGLFGMLAAILPARRASKLNVLDAISHE